MDGRLLHFILNELTSEDKLIIHSAFGKDGDIGENERAHDHGGWHRRPASAVSDPVHLAPRRHQVGPFEQRAGALHVRELLRHRQLKGLCHLRKFMFTVPNEFQCRRF